MLLLLSKEQSEVEKRTPGARKDLFLGVARTPPMNETSRAFATPQLFPRTEQETAHMNTIWNEGVAVDSSIGQ